MTSAVVVVVVVVVVDDDVVVVVVVIYVVIFVVVVVERWGASRSFPVWFAKLRRASAKRHAWGRKRAEKGPKRAAKGRKSAGKVRQTDAKALRAAQQDSEACETTRKVANVACLTALSRFHTRQSRFSRLFCAKTTRSTAFAQQRSSRGREKGAAHGSPAEKRGGIENSGGMAFLWGALFSASPFRCSPLCPLPPNSLSFSFSLKTQQPTTTTKTTTTLNNNNNNVNN